jgi:hypothetical protein
MGYYVKIYNDKVSYCTVDEGWTAFLEHNAIVEEKEVDSKVSGYDSNPHFVCIDEKAGRVSSGSSTRLPPTSSPSVT